MRICRVIWSAGPSRELINGDSVIRIPKIVLLQKKKIDQKIHCTHGYGVSRPDPTRMQILLPTGDVCAKRSSLTGSSRLCSGTSHNKYAKPISPDAEYVLADHLHTLRFC